LEAVQVVRDSGAICMGVIGIFTYDFDVAKDNFKKHDCRYDCISNYPAMLKEAAKSGYINADQIKLLEEWRNDPKSWGK